MHPANRKSGLYLSSCAVIALFGVVGAAPAMAAADAAAESADIVVTAQRKSESLAKVPVSVVAFNAETLQNKVITSEQDIGSLAPGLVVHNGQTSNPPGTKCAARRLTHSRAPVRLFLRI